MVLKLIDAHSSKPGTTILIEGQACTVRTNDISKTGKHGASKCRIEAIEILTGKKKIVAVPGDHRFDVPMIEKRKAQILSIGENKISVMDLENFETIDLPYLPELNGQFEVEKQVEYWDIEGKKVVMRILV